MNLAVLEMLVSIEASPLELRRPIDRKRDETVADGIAAANNQNLFIIYFFLLNALMRMLPNMAEQMEPRSTAIFPSDWRWQVTSGVRLENDRVSTKIDIVKPMPPRQATAKSIFQDAP